MPTTSNDVSCIFTVPDASGDEFGPFDQSQEAPDNAAEEFEVSANTVVDADDSTGLLAAPSSSMSDKRSRRKSSSRDAIRFFLGEKKGLKDSVNRAVTDELSLVAESVKKGSDLSIRTAQPRSPNVKRQSRRYSMHTRRKMRAAAWANKTTVVYRATKCLGQMLYLVFKQVGFL